MTDLTPSWIRRRLWVPAAAPPPEAGRAKSGSDAAKGTAEEAGPSSEGAFADAADRIRESAKWLLGAFAAVGALFAAGLQLQSIGQLEAGTTRSTTVVLGLLLTVGGISLAIGAAASVIGKSYVSLHWLVTSRRAWRLRRSLQADGLLVPGFSNFGELYAQAASAKEELVQSVMAHYAGRANAAAMIPIQQAIVKNLDPVVDNVVEVASYERLLRAWQWSKRAMFLGALLTAIGLALFAWGSHAPDPVEALPRTPTPVLVTFAPAERKSVAPHFGETCDLAQAVPGVALNAVGEDLTIAFPAREGCSAALVVVDPSLGSVRRQPAGSDPEE